MKDINDKEALEIQGGILWIPMVVIPIAVGVAIGTSNQVVGAIINNWDAFKQGFKETAL